MQLSPRLYSKWLTEKVLLLILSQESMSVRTLTRGFKISHGIAQHRSVFYILRLTQV